MIILFLTIAVVGLLGATVLFPLVGNLIVASRKSPGFLLRYDANPQCGKVSRITVIIPAHNEARVIGKTLDSIAEAISDLRHIRPDLEVNVLVGADGCSDTTAQIARDAGVEVIEASPSLGKWKMLKTLLEKCSSADWVVFADGGILWSRNFLCEMVSVAERDSRVAGIAPTYRNPAGGRVEAALWEIEKALKALEGRAGGPVTIHGATVAYRSTDVRRAIAILGDESWLNDDVVIPLMIRSQNPSARIAYLPGVAVTDQPDSGVATQGGNAQEFVRRRRMVAGNAQWMRGLLGGVWHLNPLAGLLALRRVFRLLWAYWVVLGATAGALLLAALIGVNPLIVIGVGLTAASIGCFLVAPLQRIVDAAYASLLAPYYLFRSQQSRPVVWR